MTTPVRMPLAQVTDAGAAGAPVADTSRHEVGVATHCPYCALQCAMTLTGSTAADLRVGPRRFPTNRGGLCQKGWTAAAVLRTPGPADHAPGARRDGELLRRGVGRSSRPRRRRHERGPGRHPVATRSRSSAVAG